MSHAAVLRTCQTPWMSGWPVDVFGGVYGGMFAGEDVDRSEEHTSELQSLRHLVCRLLLGTKKHTSELQSLRHLVCRLLLEKKKHISDMNKAKTRLRAQAIAGAKCCSLRRIESVSVQAH